MIKLMGEYIIHSDGGELNNKITNNIMNKFFWYADKIIMGIINAYKFTRFAELEDLIQEARMAILLSIHKEQYDKDKGTIFNFISVVAARNLINYTTKINRNYQKKSDADIDVFFNNESLTFYQDYDQNILLDDVHTILLEYFSGKPRLVKLTDLLVEYYKTHRSSRFIKKHFIQFAHGHGYSSAMVNTFFEMIARGRHKKYIQEFLDLAEGDKIEKNNNAFKG